MPPRRISLSEVDCQNVVYSDAEQTVIKNALKTTEAGLLRLATLRSNGPARRCQLKDRIRRCNVALAPFKKVPKEIWMYIFQLYCHSGRMSIRDTRQTRVVITQVCSAWRQIALSMPRLWRDVQLHDDLNLNMARIWLGRAGKIPRALNIPRSPYPWCACDRELPTHHWRNLHRRKTIQSFLCSFPFRKLHLTECDAVGIDFTAIPVKSLLPLEDLALLKPDCRVVMEVTYLAPHHFPHLVSLQIKTNMMPHFHVSRPFATWKKLRVLRLERELDKVQCLEILRDASSVEDCSLCLTVASFSGQDSTIENAVLANLKIFKLSFLFVSVLWQFLDHLTFPNLYTLILIPRGSIAYQPRDKLSLLRLAPRIRSLRSLNIHHFYEYVDVGLVLECLPLLQVLELHCGKITTHTAEKIGRGELGGCLRELRDWNSRNLYELLQACELRQDVKQGSGAIGSLEKVLVRYSKSQSVTDCKRRICNYARTASGSKCFESPAECD